MATALVASGFASSAASASTKSGVIIAVGAENEYANVLSQIGGKYVKVSSILNNPNTDPHTFEASASVAEVVSKAELIVQNGVGYDSFMNNIEAASPNSKRKVITVQNVLGLPSDTKNPHLWYNPKTMPAVSKVMAKDLEEIEPSHKAYFEANLAKFNASLEPWFKAIAAFKAKYARNPRRGDRTGRGLSSRSDGREDLDPVGLPSGHHERRRPAPEDITLEDGYFTKHQVKVFCYNQQVVDSLTTLDSTTALKNKVPVVGVYETMPTPGYDYQTWMEAEVASIQAAVVAGKSTQKL